ncbi:hypothetical protein l11_02010 [Neisseria weaveri LMG 5135]|nr:hypothetical protein l11_02010 [Neisseria weaveri LMG 5135]
MISTANFTAQSETYRKTAGRIAVFRPQNHGMMVRALL